MIVKTHLVCTEILLASFYYKQLEVERNYFRNNFFLKAAILIEAHFIEEHISRFSSWDLADLLPASYLQLDILEATMQTQVEMQWLMSDTKHGNVRIRITMF